VTSAVIFFLRCLDGCSLPSANATRAKGMPRLSWRDATCLPVAGLDG
jgi:hypothetical protein